MEYGIFNVDVQKLDAKVTAFMKRFNIERNEAVEGVADVLGIDPEELKSALYEAEIVGLIRTDD